MKRITAINEAIAVKMTLIFGSMWTAYLFFLYGFGPILFPAYMEKMLYWSNTVQLWSLPLLMVGTNILGRTTETLIRKMYEMIKEELAELRGIRRAELAEMREIKKLCAGCAYMQEGAE